MSWESKESRQSRPGRFPVDRHGHAAGRSSRLSRQSGSRDPEHRPAHRRKAALRGGFHVAAPSSRPNRANIVTGGMPSLNGARNNGLPLPMAATTFVDIPRCGPSHGVARQGPDVRIDRDPDPRRAQGRVQWRQGLSGRPYALLRHAEGGAGDRRPEPKRGARSSPPRRVTAPPFWPAREDQLKQAARCGAVGSFRRQHVSLFRLNGS